MDYGSGVQVDVATYDRRYHSKERYYSRVKQIFSVLDQSSRLLFAIGVGNGFVARELRNVGIDVTTVDIVRGINTSY